MMREGDVKTWPVPSSRCPTRIESRRPGAHVFRVIVRHPWWRLFRRTTRLGCWECDLDIRL
jgi:hypothetical protein